MVCFGCRAHETTRGTAMSQLIRWGATQATVTVELKNEGPDAYHPELYGDTIIVVRKITEKSSTYQLRNSTRMISNKLQDLRDLCDYFNIQVSNPAVVMTQETSKKFLTSKNDADKYTFFLKATQLEPYK